MVELGGATSTQPRPEVAPCASPPRYKRALLSFVGLLGPVYFVPPTLAAWLPLPPPALFPLSLALIVVLMTYVILPALQRLFGPWLQPRS